MHAKVNNLLFNDINIDVSPSQAGLMLMKIRNTDGKNSA